MGNKFLHPKPQILLEAPVKTNSKLWKEWRSVILVMKDLETLMQGKFLKEQRESEAMKRLFLGCNAKDLSGKGAAGGLRSSNVVLLVMF